MKKVFSVYDEKSEAYLRPFFLETIGQATRAIIDCLGDPNHDFARHSADYTLFLLGEFNEATGEFTAEKKPLGNLVEFKPESQTIDNVTQISGG
jgi:hypothetical protein